MADPQNDLFPPPPPPPADGPVRGQIDGPPDWREGFGAGLRIYCGPIAGWRDFGEVLTVEPVIVFHRNRLMVGLTWDLGPHKVPKQRRADPVAALPGQPAPPDDEEEDEGE